jgi:thiol peroxidase
MREILFKGSPLTLVGREIKPGAPAPDFQVTAQDLTKVTLPDFSGKTKIFTTFPSLDTPVCDLQVKEFNKRATGLSGDIAIAGISMDLPFAQHRFCETFEIKNVRVLSDYKTASFGINYGLLIKELRLLARSVLIVDKSDSLRYMQVVKELTTPPDYEDVLKNLESVLNNPAQKSEGELPGHCKPCEGGVLPLPADKINRLLAASRGWELIEGKKITKEFKFKDFAETKYFLDLVAVIAEEQGHHPVMTASYGKLKIALATHAAGGLTDNDFIMARLIDELGG